jgi:hypothetical protein
VAILVAGWFIIRRGLRPLERIADGAATIAAGDLSHRVDLPNDRSEVGLVGAAFDDARPDRGVLEEERAALAEKDRASDGCASSWPTRRTSSDAADRPARVRRPLPGWRPRRSRATRPGDGPDRYGEPADGRARRDLSCSPGSTRDGLCDETG